MRTSNGHPLTEEEYARQGEVLREDFEKSGIDRGETPRC